MFYYYGRKQKIVKYYPEPKCDLIIEPFAGSAAYSMEYHERDVILVEKNEKIAGVWDYLINITNTDEIMSLPLLVKGESLNDEKFSFLTNQQKNLIGLFLNPGSSTPKKSPGHFCAWNEKNKLKLSEDINKVKHWQIIHGDYRQLSDLHGTYFVDPPYFGNGGKYYQHGNKNFNYVELADWCKSRKGQIIVCENTEANWLEFVNLVDIKGQKHKTTEVIYYLENE